MSMMYLRVCLRTFSALIVSYLLVASIPTGLRADDRPNIIFIFSDDHATKAVSAYDDSLLNTPNIDRIAREGIRFTNCFVTNSLCSPSRAVVLTGKHSHLNGKTTNSGKAPFDGSQTTFPKLLRDAGYQTAIFGKWHLYSEPTGFDRWVVLPGQGFYYKPEFRTPDGMITVDGYVTDVITDMSLKWLKEERDKDRPFLLMCHHKAPHREVLPAIRHLGLFESRQIPEPETLFENVNARGTPFRKQNIRLDSILTLSGSLRLPPKITGESRKQGAGKFRSYMSRFTPEERKAWNKAYGPGNRAYAKSRPTGDELTRWKYQRIMKDYLRTIVAVDENVGRILDYLEESGLAENTVVVYTSDQGFFLGEHGLFNKRFMYEESLRIPLVIRWPDKIKPGSVSQRLVQNLDFAQTFLDIAGVDAPSDMQGRSLLPIIEGDSLDEWRDAVYYHYYGSTGTFVVPAHYGIRTKRYKLIYFYELGVWELYDLQTDPKEMKNVIDCADYAKVVKELKQRLAELQQQYKEDDNIREKWTP